MQVVILSMSFVLKIIIHGPVYNLPIAYFLYVHVNEKSFQPMSAIPTPNA